MTSTRSCEASRSWVGPSSTTTRSRSASWPSNVVERYIPVDNPDDIPAIAAAMANKRVCIEIVPEKVVSWDHRKLAGRY